MNEIQSCLINVDLISFIWFILEETQHHLYMEETHIGTTLIIYIYIYIHIYIYK